MYIKVEGFKDVFEAFSFAISAPTDKTHKQKIFKDKKQTPVMLKRKIMQILTKEKP